MGTQNDIIPRIDEWIMKNVEKHNENEGLNDAPNSNENDEH